MNWDWDKLQEKRQRQSGNQSTGGPNKPEFDQFGEGLKKLKGIKFPFGRLVIVVVVILWLLSGIYIVEPAELGLVMRFGEFNRTTQPGPHYHWPFPIESVLTPDVAQIRRIEVGFRSLSRERNFQQGQLRLVPEESLMLTGDENIVDVQFIVQYQIKDPVKFLFNVSDQVETVKSAAEAAMREVVGDNNIDSVLTTGKLEIQNGTRKLLQDMLGMYDAGVRIVAVQLQDVHPPKEVVEAFKDVASAREDKSKIINQAEAYRNDLLPRARGSAAKIVNQAEAYKEAQILSAQGEASRFLSILAEYNQAKDVTRERLYLETMEKIFSNPNLEKLVLSDEALKGAMPFLPLGPVTGSQKTKSASGSDKSIQMPGKEGGE